MKIGYVATTVFPHYWVDTQQVIKNADALAKSGCHVDLIIPRKWDRCFFLKKTKRIKRLASFYGLEIQFNLIDVPHVPPSSLDIQKVFHAFFIPFYFYFKKYDLIYTRAFWTLAVCSLFKIPCVLENHRLIQQDYKFYYKLFKFSMKRKALKGVVTNASLISNHYISLGLKSERVLTAHNAFDGENMLPVLSKKDARKALDLDPDESYFCYTGNIRKYKGIEFLLKLAGRLKAHHWLICGGYPKDVADARSLASRLNVTNVTFFGFIPVDDLSTFLYAADYLVIPPTKKPFEKYKKTIMPIKTYTYLAAGRPIFAPNMKDTQEVLSHKKNAILLPPDDLDQCALDVEKYIQDKNLMKSISNDALESSKQYTWKSRGEKISSFLDSILKSG